MREPAMNASINGREYTFEPGETILQVARRNGIFIPTLCHFQPLDHKPGTCRVCLAEVTDKHGRTETVTTCNTPMEEGMRVNTMSPRVRRMQRLQVELVFADHDQDCAACARHGDCELQDLAEYVGLSTNRFAPRLPHERPLDNTMHGMVRDMSKCIRCLRCVEVCRKVQGVAALTVDGTGTGTHIGVGMAPSQNTSACIQCGQCTLVCPTGALAERDENDEVLDYLANPELTTVFAFAPSVRVVMGEEFGLAPGENVEGRIVAALRRLGADIVIDTDFAADVVIMEEGTELLGRIRNGGRLPMFTSCCPGWINYAEKHCPEVLPYVSSTRSPQAVSSSLVKSYLVEKTGISPRKIRNISIMPCTAKKMEAAREEFKHGDQPDVDLVLTTQELIRMIKEAGIRFNELPDEAPDMPFGLGTGAGVIFGATGGVAEAVVRRVMESESRNTLQEIAYSGVRGMEGVRAVELPVGEKTIRVGVAHGLKNARTLIEKMEAGEARFDLVEVMTCTTGCVGGAGQPIGRREQKYARAEGLYEADRKTLIKSSQHNPILQALYERITPERAHELLHVQYPQPE